jgi:DNA polymerase elongation subunit (family B)
MSTFYTSVDRLGNNILFCGYKNGERIRKRIPYKPTFYVSTDKKSEWKTLQGNPVDELNPGSMKDCQDFLREYSEVENFKIYGNNNFVIQFISDAFLDRGIEFDRDIINVTTIDIEVQSDQGFPHAEEANFPVTAICLKNNIDNIFYVFGTGDWNEEDSVLSADLSSRVKHIKCNDEAMLLMKFLDQWQANYPDVLTGWNSRFFDTVYLVNRIGKVLGKDMVKKLSPWGVISERQIQMAARTQQAFELRGIQQLDFMDCFKKFGYTYGTQESYKLDNIAHVVLGEKKIDYSEYGTLHSLYKENYQLFIDYNVKDVDIVDRLEDKTGLITLAMTIAYKALVNMVDAFGPVGMWDALLYNKLKKRKIVVPPKEDHTKERQIEGAHVKVPQNGMHDWIVSFDLNSLYPHIIMQYNMSPETIVNERCYGVTVNDLLNKTEYEKPDNYSMSATGQYFDKSKRGIVPEIIDGLYTERSAVKKEMLKTEQEVQDKGSTYELEKKIVTLNNQQMATKILMNSLYGALSNQYFRYYDMRIAESITVTGQLTIRWAENIINKYMRKLLKTEEDYVVAIDTDSLYIRTKDLVEKALGEKLTADKGVKFLDKVASEKFEPLLAKSYDKLCSYMNGYEQRMVMKREVIADKGIWTGKKHYALNVYNSEGVQYTEPKLKIMGIEVVRSSTPMPCRNMLKDTIRVIMTTDEKTTQKYIQECRDKFNSLPPEDIAFPRGVSDIDKWKDRSTIYKKGCPIHVRGALLYNFHVNEMELESHDPIFSGDKVKFVYLKVPNILHENVIAFTASGVPKEFGIQNNIDYDLQFQKAYLEPLNSILNVIEWSAEKQMTLDMFI